MIFFLKRRNWKRKFSEVIEKCVLFHIIGDWYIVRDRLKNSNAPWRQNFIWFIINKNDFLSE